MANQAPIQVQMPTVPGVGVFAPQKGNTDYFIYPVYLASLAPADPATPVTVNISADSDFYWNATTYQVAIANAAFLDGTRPIPNITVQIQDNGSNRNLFQVPVPMEGVAGRGEFPYRLVHPRLFTRSTTLTVTLDNYDAAATYVSIYFLMHGFKVYTLG